MLLTALSRFREGDTHAFSQLYDASYNRVYAFIYHRTLDTHMTEDIVSMVYMKAMKSAKSLRAKTEGEFFSWIFRIAYTTLIDTVKSEQAHDEIDEESGSFGYSQNLSHDIDNKNKLEEVLSFLSTFKERDRAILTLRIWDDLSYEEISTITGESIDNCKKIVSRSLAKITANISYMFILSLVLYYVRQN